MRHRAKEDPDHKRVFIFWEGGWKLGVGSTRRRRSLFSGGKKNIKVVNVERQPQASEGRFREMVEAGHLRFLLLPRRTPESAHLAAARRIIEGAAGAAITVMAAEGRDALRLARGVRERSVERRSNWVGSSVFKPCPQAC